MKRFFLVFLFFVATSSQATDFALQGVVHASLDLVSNGENSALEVNSNDSKFVLTGEEKINDYLRLTFRAENLFSFSSNNVRNDVIDDPLRFVMVADTPLGFISVGRQDAPFKLLGRRLDLFSDQAGDARILTRFPVQTLGDPSPTDFDALPISDLVGYTSPSFYGFSASYYRRLGGCSCGEGSSEILDVSLSYEERKKKRFFVSYGYQRLERGLGGEQPEAQRLGFRYRFLKRNMTLVLFYQNSQNVDGIAGNDGDVYGIGYLYQRDIWRYKIQYYQSNNSINQGNGSLLAAGIELIPSENHKFYLAYGITDNDDAVTFGGDDSAINALPGKAFQVLSLGYVRSF